MNKNEDALRAVTEYLQKPNISQIGLANLNRLQAFLLMISVDNNFIMASIKHFKTAQEIYHSLRMPNGVAICQLGILKIFHDKFEEIVAEMLPEQKDKLIKKCLNLINNSYELFVKFQSDNGKIQCKLIENSLNEKIKTKINSGKDLKSEQVTIHYSSMIHKDIIGSRHWNQNKDNCLWQPPSHTPLISVLDHTLVTYENDSRHPKNCSRSSKQCLRHTENCKK